MQKKKRFRKKEKKIKKNKPDNLHFGVAEEGSKKEQRLIKRNSKSKM